MKPSTSGGSIIFADGSKGTLMRIRTSTRDRIVKHAKYGDVLDDVIVQILDKVEKKR